MSVDTTAKVPVLLSLENRGESWRQFKREWKFYEIASKMSKLLRGRRGANSGVDERNWPGRNGSILDTFQWQANEDERKIKDVGPTA